MTVNQAEIFAELDRAPSLRAYTEAAKRLENSDAELAPLRVGILANHTFEIETHLFVECARRGFHGVFYQGGYDQYRQDLLSPGSSLDSFQPDAMLISLDLLHAFPGLSRSATVPLPSIDEWVDGLQSLLTAYRKRSATPIFLHDFLPPATDLDGLLPSSMSRSVFDWVMELNRYLHKLSQVVSSMFVIGLSQIACRSGLAAWHDERMRYIARVGINAKRFPVLASHVARYLAALRRPPAKCLVLDLDGTLWGGVLGDAGPDGICCAGGDYPASAYADFQRALLTLRARGILLAVASKNDSSIVEEAFRTRTDMPLRPEHVTDWEINWEPKPESLQRIAARLNIGIDSLVFLDDNPDEIRLVKMALPQVRAYLMPRSPENFVEFLAGLEDFDQLQISTEDLRRAELYEVRKNQATAAAEAIDLESFYRSLETFLSPEPANKSNFDRIIQLLHKTNQFNLTTRRHDETALRAHLDQGSELWAFRVNDVNGDHGLIAVALIDFVDATASIETFLMSCRVIGRTIETAILHFLEERAAARGAQNIRGEFLSTPKNGPCRDFYARHGFHAVTEDEGYSEWIKRLADERTPCPEWITVRFPDVAALANTEVLNEPQLA